MPGTHFRMLTNSLLVAICCLLTACGTSGPGGHPPLTLIGSPAAQINVESLYGFAGGDLDFYGQGIDPAGGPVTYAWDFESDGVVDDTTQNPLYTLPAVLPPGQRVRLTVTGAGGLTSTAEAVICMAEVSDPLVGVAVRAFSLVGAPATVFRFHAPVRIATLVPGAIELGTESTSAITWDWDYDGDGAVDDTTSDPHGSWVYSAPGSYPCHVLVTDSLGRTGEAHVTVIVCEMLPSPPAGQIIHRGLAYSLWSNFSAFEGEPLPLTAHCVDPDGGPVVVAWDLDGDGMFDDGIGQHAILVPTRTDTIRVSIRMTDDEGQRSYASVSIRVDRSAVDFDDVFRAKAPVVGVLADVITPTVGQVVTFLGTAGDVDSYVLSWDFDGDGIEDASDPSPGTTFIPVAHAFTTPGIYTPELTVTDSEGFVSHAYVTVVVLACSDAGDEPPLSTVECDCGARVILHGGLTELVIECDPPRGGLLAGITSVAGTGRPPDDPLATGLTVTDHDGLVFATPAPAPRPVGATPIRISAESLHVDGPARIVPYTITVRVEDPGVWVYVMKCRVSVMHLGVVANMRVAGDPPFHTGDFTIYTPPSEQDDVLEIAELELDFDIQVPAWSQVDDVRDLPAGWAAEISQDRLRIFLEQGGGGLPLRPGALPFRFKVDFRTSDAEQFPLSGEIRFYGREGDLLGTEPLNVK